MEQLPAQIGTTAPRLDARQAWHTLPVSKVVGHLETEIERGLSSEEARRRLKQHGHNELREQARPAFWRLLLEQFNNFVVIILIVASIVSAALGDWIEAAAIMAIVVLDAVLGVVLYVYRLGVAWGGIPLGHTMAFVSLSLAELPIAYTARSERYPLYRIGPFSNRWMQPAVGVSILLLLAVVYVPFLQDPFNTVALSWRAWQVMLPLAFTPAIAAEVTKGALRWWERRQSSQDV